MVKRRHKPISDSEITTLAHRSRQMKVRSEQRLPRFRPAKAWYSPSANDSARSMICGALYSRALPCLHPGHPGAVGNSPQQALPRARNNRARRDLVPHPLALPRRSSASRGAFHQPLQRFSFSRVRSRCLYPLHRGAFRGGRSPNRTSLIANQARVPLFPASL
jgi:hypothetical protein